MRRRKTAVVAVALVGIEAAALRHQTGRLAGRVVVRCRDGHLFTTLWIPGASLKALRLGPRRFQRCPVGHHWSLVTPVDESSLSAEELELARSHADGKVP